jgi:hypothetical protein
MESYHLRRTVPARPSVVAVASGLPGSPVVGIDGGAMRDLVPLGADAFCGLLHAAAPTGRLKW